MTTSEQNTLNQILTRNCLKYKNHKTCQECNYWEDCKGKNVNMLIISAVREWLQHKLDAMPKGEWGEKSMLLELLDELKKS